MLKIIVPPPVTHQTSSYIVQSSQTHINLSVSLEDAKKKRILSQIYRNKTFTIACNDLKIIHGIIGLDYHYRKIPIVAKGAMFEMTYNL